MTREERLELLKQIEKDIHVCSLESTFLEDAKSCAIHSVIEELEQEPTAKNDLAVDCISRQFIYELGATCIATRNENGKLVALGAIEGLPSVTPIRPKGHWIEHEHSNGILHIECSECSSWFLRAHLLRNSFCPNCGAKMEEVEE